MTETQRARRDICHFGTQRRAVVFSQTIDGNCCYGVEEYRSSSLWVQCSQHATTLQYNLTKAAYNAEGLEEVLQHELSFITHRTHRMHRQKSTYTSRNE